MKQFIKDLPLYINGFSSAFIFFQIKLSFTNIIVYILLNISFFWYGYNKTTK
jgi:hypothetical protein